jgi:tetratricopeptide (TPR) repeat protein
MSQAERPEVEGLSERDLIRRGVAAWKSGNSRRAGEYLLVACERFTEQDVRVPASVLSLYAACLANEGKLKEAVEMCRAALADEPHNAEAHLNLARVYLAAGSRRKAVESLNRGLAIAPRHPALLTLRERLGRRKSPVLPFLPRGNPINVALGRARASLKTPPKTK